MTGALRRATIEGFRDRLNEETHYAAAFDVMRLWGTLTQNMQGCVESILACDASSDEKEKAIRVMLEQFTRRHLELMTKWETHTLRAKKSSGWRDQSEETRPMGVKP